MYKFLDGKSYLLGAQSNKKDIERLKADVENLKDAARGKLYNEQVLTADSYSDIAYAGTVPYAMLDKVGGKTLVWNQLAPYLREGDWQKNEATITDGVARVTPTSTWRGVYNPTPAINYINGHKYIVSVDARVVNQGESFTLGVSAFGTTADIAIINTSTFARYSVIITSLETGTSFRIANRNGVYPYEMKNIQVFDLTTMFGAGNEPTAEQFAAMFPAEYYPYSEPTLMDFSTESVVSKGRNIWDEQWVQTDYIPYRSITYDISALARKYFPDGMKSAGAVHDELDLEHKVAIKRVGSVDLGTLAWYYSNAMVANVAGMANGVIGTMPNAISDRYPIGIFDRRGEYTNSTITVVNESNRIDIRNVGTDDPAVFRANVSGVMLNYELAEPVITPITEDIDPYIAVEGGGTVEYHNDHGDEYLVPVAHQMTYLTKIEV